MQSKAPYLVLALGLAGLGFTACAKPPAAVFDGIFPDGRKFAALGTLIDEPLHPEEQVRFETIGRDEHSSHHLIWVRIGVGFIWLIWFIWFVWSVWSIWSIWSVWSIWLLSCRSLYSRLTQSLSLWPIRDSHCTKQLALLHRP